MAMSVSTPAMIALTLGGKPVYEVVQRKEPWDMMHMLGVRAVPDGNFRQEAKFLIDKVDGYATRLLRLSLTKMDTFIFHRSTYTLAIGWSSSVTTLDRQSLNRIQQKSIAAILQKLGMN